MFEQTEPYEEKQQRKPVVLAMPRQAPPIDRTGQAVANADGSNQGVEASGIVTSLLSKFLPF